MNAIAKALPELVGGSADLDPSTKTYLKGFGEFEPGTYGGRNIHYGVREHAMAAATNGIALHGGMLAVLRDLLQLPRLPASRRCGWPRSTRCARSTSSPTTRCSWAKTVRRTSRSSSSRCCARRRTSSTSARPTRSKRSTRGSSRSSRETGPTVIVLSRQKLPYLGDREAPVSARRLRPRRADRRARPHPHRDRLGGFAGRRLPPSCWRQRGRTRASSRCRPGISSSSRTPPIASPYCRPRSRPASRSKRPRRSAGTSTSATAGSPTESTTSELRRRRRRIAKEYGFTPEHIADVATGLLAGV